VHSKVTPYVKCPRRIRAFPFNSPISSNFPKPSRGSPSTESVGKPKRGSSGGSKIDLTGTVGPERGPAASRKPERGPLGFERPKIGSPAVIGSISLSRGL